MNARAVLMKVNLAKFIRTRTTRFITLTLRNQPDESPGQMLTRLRRSLTMLYRRPLWKHHVLGWCAFFEIKRGKRFGGWHVHAHCISEGKFVAQRDLANEWHAVTGDSMIVDIRAVTDAAGGAHYAAKYATKGCNLGDLDTDQELDQVVHEITHRRLWSVHGIWKGKLKLDDKPPDPKDWIWVANMNDVITMSANGDIGAATLFNELFTPRAARPPPPQ